MRVIFYAEPTENSPPPKTEADGESEEARWVTLEELLELNESPPYWRGKELYHYSKYLEDGGQIYPMAMFGMEG
eukprot:CAMPEP_0205830534 /NCGR_PEP_ID=MMETSP0206-20130828/41313_1 /ASSEMBLY_ACC=CAM_ASM_000279 /TAXON_ID=36767 /ORGANISM="Euplotes focardii, Strain TN1" /LENGTH=73 /DNA_ID=CAMNT_0053134277 /DNA_START=213 /DNA_END=431 /DNA_ORIENTATION=-